MKRIRSRKSDNMSKKQKTSNQYAIEVIDVSKQFKLFYDKHYTLKERLVFWKNKMLYFEVI